LAQGSAYLLAPLILTEITSPSLLAVFATSSPEPVTLNVISKTLAFATTLTRSFRGAPGRTG
jgi:hypothetical protein